MAPTLLLQHQLQKSTNTSSICLLKASCADDRVSVPWRWDRTVLTPLCCGRSYMGRGLRVRAAWIIPPPVTHWGGQPKLMVSFNP